mmetsp:Transcript_37936/g.90763  ORF Transcript_37936/g.90763 Transcript_37936/m.90763 type:complete len:275 (+) Transcript_37936:734-1558(+)
MRRELHEDHRAALLAKSGEGEGQGGRGEEESWSGGQRRQPRPGGRHRAQLRSPSRAVQEQRPAGGGRRLHRNPGPPHVSNAARQRLGHDARLSRQRRLRLRRSGHRHGELRAILRPSPAQEREREPGPSQERGPHREIRGEGAGEAQFLQGHRPREHPARVPEEYDDALSPEAARAVHVPSSAEDGARGDTARHDGTLGRQADPRARGRQAVRRGRDCHGRSRLRWLPAQPSQDCCRDGFPGPSHRERRRVGVKGLSLGRSHAILLIVITLTKS